MRDKDIVAASDCRGLIVFETLCGIYVMVDCYVRYIVCYWGEFMIRTHNKLTYWNARFGMSGFSRKSATVLSDCIGIRYLSIR